MAPLNSLDTWAVRSSSGSRRPKSRCFFIGEGPNTEFWYLSGLAERLARMDVPELIELRTVERTGDEKGQSAPVKLLDHARAVRDDPEGRFGFDPDCVLQLCFLGFHNIFFRISRFPAKTRERFP